VPGITKVVLVKGSVSVLPNQGGEYKIKPGELAVLLAAQQDVIYPVKRIFLVSSDSNTTSLLYQRDITFIRLSKEQLSKTKRSEDTKKIRFTGDIDRYGSIEPILKAIQRVTHLEMEIQGKTIIIKK